jgi:glycosyltransferase involved in cell wall biosynthesis
MENKKSALFIMPRRSTAWHGAEALWITVAGWAAAAERKFEKVWIITTDRVATADEVISYPRKQGNKTMNKVGKFGFVPQLIKTFLKDALLFKNRNTKIYPSSTWENKEIAFVWEQHDLFSGPGRKLASRLGVPLVLYVHAPAVWESSKWGVRRPLWGWFLEFFFERASLRRADLVACVSEQVAVKLRKLGIAPDKIIISPMGVDPYRFQISKHEESSIRNEYDLLHKFVIGWIGSFRGFHGLDSVLRVFASIAKRKPNIILMLVGDGAGRKNIEDIAESLGIRHNVLFIGKVDFTDIPKYVTAFDVAVVSAGNASDFHYSPLKLREYLVACKATLAPDAGEVPRVFSNEKDLLLYKVGDEKHMEDQLIRLIENPSLRDVLSKTGKLKILKSGTWDFELEKVLDYFGLLQEVKQNNV